MGEKDSKHQPEGGKKKEKDFQHGEPNRTYAKGIREWT